MFRRNAASWGHLVVDRVYSGVREEGVHLSLSETALRLSDAEARELSRELTALVDGWADRTRGRHDQERRTYLYFGAVLPHPGTDAADG